MNKTIMIIAGEASGDLHGSSLAFALKELDPGVKLIGMGGEKMVKAGVLSFQDIRELSVIGVLEVLSNLKKFKAAFNLLVNKLDSEKPDCVVLIDYPEFNLRFAKEAKKRNIPVLYYISPQIWAWRKGRIETVRKFVDKMIVIFGFEKKFYEKEGVAVEFVGHPLLDVVKPRLSKEEFLKKQGLSDTKKTVALLPGSREIEVIRNLPVMVSAGKLIKNTCGDNVQFLVAKPRETKKETYAAIFNARGFKPVIVEDYPYDCINSSDVVLVASGTATLETAILEKPMLIIYKVSLLTWLVGKILVKIPHIGLVNIVAGKGVVPEYIQFDAIPAKIAEETIGLLAAPEKSSKITSELKSVKEKLGTPGASKRAAQAVISALGG